MSPYLNRPLRTLAEVESARAARLPQTPEPAPLAGLDWLAVTGWAILFGLWFLAMWIIFWVLL